MGWLVSWLAGWLEWEGRTCWWGIIKDGWERERVRKRVREQDGGDEEKIGRR